MKFDIGMVTGLVIFGLTSLVSGSLYLNAASGEEAFTQAWQRESRIKMEGNEASYADPAYLEVAKNLDRVPPWSEHYGEAQAKLEAITSARRIKANDIFQLSYLPTELEGVTLASLGPSLIDKHPRPKAPATVAKAVPDEKVSLGTQDSSTSPESAKDTAESGKSVENAQVNSRESETKVTRNSIRVSPDETEKAIKKARSAATAQPIIIYTTSWCGYCKRARQYFTQNGIPFIDKDVERDSDAAREMAQKVGGYGGVPVIDIDGAIIRGFDVPAVERALARREKVKKS